MLVTTGLKDALKLAKTVRDELRLAELQAAAKRRMERNGRMAHDCS